MNKCKGCIWATWLSHKMVVCFFHEYVKKIGDKAFVPIPAVPAVRRQLLTGT
ncbi:hypothetical protein Psch_00522 [Pelotomaculum schinkii]|uniref:Uncharacterized protein n=1 Tax=Pelotomaculum schinkii TaxID=78350 RepID=A0A4Y7RDC1_9FIRM|nr:hypothetical protein Psch_00522 [Pelotomaculum schinkii]